MNGRNTQFTFDCVLPNELLHPVILVPGSHYLSLEYSNTVTLADIDFNTELISRLRFFLIQGHQLTCILEFEI